MMRKEYIFAGIVIVAALLMAGNYYWFNREDGPAVSPKNITLAVSFTPLSAPFFIADEKGFFIDEGIDADIREYAGGHICLEALLNGKADFATATDLPVMFRSFDRDDYEIVATFTKSNKDSKIISRKSSGITKPEDLEGKKVGVVLGASSQYFFDSFINFHRLDHNKIEIIDIQPENMSYALETGTLDAISVWEPFGYKTIQLLGNDSFIFPDTDFYMMTFNLITSKNYTKNHPGDVRKILRALDRSIEFIHNNEKESQEILMRRLDQKKGFIEWVWEGYNYELSLDQSLIMSLESEAAWAIKNNLTNATLVPNYIKYINTDCLQDVKSEAITVIQ